MKRIRIFPILLLSSFLLCSCTAFPEEARTSPLPEAAATELPSVPDETPVPDDALSADGALTANGYVLVSSATQTGWLPLPSEGEASYPLVQAMQDGSIAVNLIHLTPDGVYMEDSTCENHDCVDQGVVTLDNRYERILSNMIICLPNQVILQLYDPDEVRALVGRGMPSP